MKELKLVYKLSKKMPNMNKIPYKRKKNTRNLFSSCKRHVRSSNCFSSLFLAKRKAPASLASCRTQMKSKCDYIEHFLVPETGTAQKFYNIISKISLHMNKTHGFSPK